MKENQNPDKIKSDQSLRIRRWKAGLSAYGVAIMAIYISKFIGFEPMKLEVFCIFFVTGISFNAFLYYLFKTNKNLNFKDPSLTLIQMVLGFVWGIFPLYFMPGARMVVQIFYLTAFCFGIFRLKLFDYLKAFFILIAIYASVLVLETCLQRPNFTLSIEIFQFVLFILILLWFTFFGSYISGLRQRLQTKNIEIEQAHKALQRESEERQLAIEERKKIEDKLQRAKKMEAIGTLAGGVAHDLNNILSGIVSYPDLILLDLPEESPLIGPLTTIKKTGEKAAAIVQDLLTMARRGVPVKEIVNLNQTISEYLSSPEFEKLRRFHPNIEIKTEFQKDLLNTLGSSVHLLKIVMNLVSNSAEAMPDGGHLKISTKNHRVDKSIILYEEIDEGDYVLLTVEDSGKGLTVEDRERIFEPFYSKKVMGKSGTGLGMAVVWGSVKDHNGYIDIDSIEGKGTKASIYLPATRESSIPSPSKVPIEKYMGKGEKILIIDDVMEQREIACNMLNKLEYSVVTASSGEEALTYLEANTVDLLVLDMIMDPGIDGLETYRRILKIHPEQKAIICSGFAQTDRVKKARRLGVGAFIKKPFVMEQIGLSIKDELER